MGNPGFISSTVPDRCHYEYHYLRLSVLSQVSLLHRSIADDAGGIAPKEVPRLRAFRGLGFCQDPARAL